MGVALGVRNVHLTAITTQQREFAHFDQEIVIYWPFLICAQALGSSLMVYGSGCLG